MRSARIVLVSLFGMLLAVQFAMAASGVTAELISYGIYRPAQNASLKVIDNKKDSGKGYHQFSKLELVKETDVFSKKDIPFRMGIKFKLSKSATPVNITVRFDHPFAKNWGKFANKPLLVHQQVKSGTYTRFVDISKAGNYLPGNWKISVVHEGRTIVEKSFILQ